MTLKALPRGVLFHARFMVGVDLLSGDALFGVLKCGIYTPLVWYACWPAGDFNLILVIRWNFNYLS